jgi:hypothetical protein
MIERVKWHRRQGLSPFAHKHMKLKGNLCPRPELQIQFFTSPIVLKIQLWNDLLKAKSPTLGRRALKQGYDDFVTSKA